jgi:hypothetical protein
MIQFFEYMGFSIHRIGLNGYFVTGPGFWGYTASVTEAVNLISGYLAAQCTY